MLLPPPKPLYGFLLFLLISLTYPFELSLRNHIVSSPPSSLLTKLISSKPVRRNILNIDELTIDSSDNGGIFGLVGASQSGKSTLLRELEQKAVEVGVRTVRLQAGDIESGGGGRSDEILGFILSAMDLRPGGDQLLLSMDEVLDKETGGVRRVVLRELRRRVAKEKDVAIIVATHQIKDFPEGERITLSGGKLLLF